MMRIAGKKINQCVFNTQSRPESALVITLNVFQLMFQAVVQQHVLILEVICNKATGLRFQGAVSDHFLVTWLVNIVF